MCFFQTLWHKLFCHWGETPVTVEQHIILCVRSCQSRWLQSKSSTKAEEAGTKQKTLSWLFFLINFQTADTAPLLVTSYFYVIFKFNFHLSLLNVLTECRVITIALTGQLALLSLPVGGIIFLTVQLLILQIYLFMSLIILCHDVC